MEEVVLTYRREQELMMSAVHVLGMKNVRTHMALQPSQKAWLGNQRDLVCSILTIYVNCLTFSRLRQNYNVRLLFSFGG